ncbi:MAG: ferritin-like domain-containing protein [Sandaracinaceae bacterium]|nr:ferritin-like domain-containing protein [Sandaracinaceae bacterium]
MREPFDLEWMGGVAERAFRKVRPDVDSMPWGTLDVSDLPAKLIDRARVAWTEAAFNEYCTAAAFAELVGALLRAKAPIDLIGWATDFLADEILHVELTSRVAMELGGGAPYEIDFASLTLPIDEALDPLQRANELVVRTCCVGEAFSLPMLATAFRSASHPLPRAVLERIVKDEAPHGRFGLAYLEWAAPEMDGAERERLGRSALATLRLFAPFWARLSSRVTGGVTSEGFLVEHVTRVGFSLSEDYAKRARRAAREEVIEPLARFGIVLPREETEALLSAGTLGL